MPLSVEPFEEIKRISEGMDFSHFDCENPDFNDFIKNEALMDQRNGYSITYTGIIGGFPAAFVTLIAAAYRAEDFKTAEINGYRYYDIPAIKIARMATDSRFQRRGCGRTLLKYSLAIALSIREKIGCRLLITDALPERINWYIQHGFSLTSSSKRMAPGRKTYPMHADLRLSEMAYE